MRPAIRKAGNGRRAPTRTIPGQQQGGPLLRHGQEGLRQQPGLHEEERGHKPHVIPWQPAKPLREQAAQQDRRRDDHRNAHGACQAQTANHPCSP